MADPAQKKLSDLARGYDNAISQRSAPGACPACGQSPAKEALDDALADKDSDAPSVKNLKKSLSPLGELLEDDED